MPEWREYPLPGAGGPGQPAVLVYPGVLSPQLRNYRDIVAALPPGYPSGGGRYPVVYMHDGQNLFDPTTSYAGDWGLIPVLAALAAEGVEAIVVGIPNRGRRRSYEYSPFRDRIHGGGGGDRYLAFLIETIKPLVDASFRTLPARTHTVVAGSSMGGLISLYALFRHPEVFGAAGALSPALWFADRALLGWVAATPTGSAGRVHLDIGVGEGAEAVADVRALRDLLLTRGLREGPGGGLSYVEEPEAEHEEAAWGRRFRAALPFLLGIEEPACNTSITPG